MRCWLQDEFYGAEYDAPGLSEALHNEIEPLGLRSICFDLGYFRTSFLTADHRGAEKERIADYKAINEKGVGGLAGELRFSREEKNYSPQIAHSCQ